MSHLKHLSRGCLSLLALALHPLGRFTEALVNDLRSPQRLERGLVLVLPGIEGESCVNHNIARGLADGGVGAAIEIFDWTTGVILLFLYHLRGKKRQIRQADRLVQRIVDYRQSHPGRPVHLVGHSGGAAIVVLSLERLPPGHAVTSTVLLQSAMSPDHDLTTALERTECGIWSFRSPWDVFFLGLCTWVGGNMGGRHQAAAGQVGFRQPAGLNPVGRELYETRLNEVAFRWGMMRDFNFGGHLTATSRPFVAHSLAPILISAGVHS